MSKKSSLERRPRRTPPTPLFLGGDGLLAEAKWLLDIGNKVVRTLLRNSYPFFLNFRRCPDVVAACEIVNCNGVEVQCQGSAPTISVDNTSGCQVYLSKDSLEASITTAKSSEINVMVPASEADGDWITCKCSAGGDAHATTMSLLHLLSSYSWDAKIAIALAALAISYGEFGLVVQLFPTHPLAKSVAVLKQLPDMAEHSNALKSRFEALHNLIGVMLEVTKRIMEFRQLPHQYISPEHPPLSVATTHIPTAAYWTTRSVFACATQLSSLIGMSYEYVSSTTEAWELSSLAHKERNIHDHLLQQLARCYEHIDEKKHIEAYNNLVRLFELSQLDNTRILRHLIYLKDDMLPLVENTTKSRVYVEALRRKTVLLLISDLDVSPEELIILDNIYKESRRRPECHYVIVWIPIIDKSVPWTDAHQQKFEQLLFLMSWYTLNHPKIMEPAAIRVE